MQSWNQWGVGGAPYNYQTAAPVSSTSAVTPDLQNYGSSNYQYYSTAGAPETAQADLTTYNQQQQYTMQQQQQQWQQWTQWQQQFQQWQQQYGDKYQQAVGGLPGVPLPPGAPTAQNGQTTATSYNPSVQPPLPPLPPSEKVVNPPLPVDPPLPSTQPIQPPLPPQPSQPPPGQPPTSQPPNQPPPALQSLPAQPPLQQPPPLMQTNQPPPSSTHQHGMHQQGYPQGQMYPGSNSSYFSGSYDSGGAPDNNQAGYYGHQEDGYAAMHQYSGTSYSSGTGGGQYEGFGSGAGGAGRKRAGAAGDGPYDSAKDIGAKKMRMDMPPQLDKLPEEEGQDGWKHWSGEGGGKGGRIEQMPGSQRGDVNKQGSAGKPKEAAPDDELSEAEKSFDAQFVQWESQFMRWKEQNKNHSDKNQYREYEAKWESWREQLLQRREQMKKKRENGKGPSSNDGSKHAPSPFSKNLPAPSEGMSKPPPFMDNSRFPHDEMRHQMQSDPKHQCDDYGHEEPRDPYPRGRGGWPNEEEFCRPQWRDEPPRNKRFDGPPREEWDDYRGMNRPLMEPPFEHRPYFEGDERGGNMGAEEARLRDLSSRPYEMDEERYMRGGPEGWEMREAHHPDPLLGPPIWDERPRASPPPAERQWAPEFVAPTVVDYGHMPRQEPPPPRPPSPPRNFTGNVQTFDYCHGVSRNPLPFAVDSVQREQWRGDEYGDREPRIVREAPRTWEHDDHSPSRGRNSSGRENQRRESRWEKPRWSNSKHGETEPSRWEEEESRYSAGSDRWGGNQSRKERERDRDRDRDRSRKSRQRGEGEERSGSSGGGNASRGNTHDSEKDRERSSRHKKEDSGSSSRNTGSGGGNGGSSGSHPLVSYPLPASSSPPPPPTISQQVQPSLAKLDTILIEDLLLPPGRATRPPRIVIILRGPPGSGKTFVAKLVKDKEVEQGGSAPRILSLDDYFMVEFEKEEKDAETGRKVTNKLMKYEYEAEMEKQYRNSLVKAFRKTVDDGYFPFIIVDCVNDKVRQFDEMWTYAKQKGFQVYICEMDMDVSMCSKRNTHGRNLRDIEEMVKHWEETPRSYVRVDVRSLLQSAAITEVEMEDTTEEKAKEESKTPEKDGELEKGGAEEDAEKIVTSSKWEGMEASEEKLDRLDGLAKKRRSENPPQSLEDWLQLTDDYEKRKCTPGKKQVRWADLEERRQQERIRAIGFVVGQTDWSRMTDPTFGQGALTQTKYI